MRWSFQEWGFEMSRALKFDKKLTRLADRHHLIAKLCLATHRFAGSVSGSCPLSRAIAGPRQGKATTLVRFNAPRAAVSNLWC